MSTAGTSWRAVVWTAVLIGLGIAASETVVDQRPAAVSFDDQVAAVRAGQSDSIQVGSRQRIGGRQFERLRELVGLRKLRMDRAELSNESAAILSGLPLLEDVTLRGARWGDPAARHLAAASRLRRLNLPHARMTDEGLRDLATLPRLELLRMGSPEVTAEGLRHLRNLSSLRFLHLIDVPIDDDGLREVAAMAGLESFYSDGGVFSDDALEELFLRRPDLHVHLNQEHHDRDPRRAHHGHPER